MIKDFRETCSPPAEEHPFNSPEDVQTRVADWMQALVHPLDPAPLFDYSQLYETKTDAQGSYEKQEKENDDIKEAILGTKAYEWLLRRIIRLLTSFTPGWSAMDAITQQVRTKISQLPSQVVSTKRRQPSHHATFEVDWSPIAFIKDQGYDDDPKDAIIKAITLTGAATEAQASLAAQYIEDTWPLSGKFMMTLVQYVVSGKSELSPKCESRVNNDHL